MTELFDLPTHIFFVHAPVVLIPLVAFVTVVVALVPGWRSRYRWALVGATLVVVAVTLLATKSGEEFEEIVGDLVDVDEHAELAGTTRLLVLAQFATVVGFAVTAGRELRRGVAVGLAALSVVLAVGSTVWVVRTGHEGAKLVWQGVLDEAR